MLMDANQPHLRTENEENEAMTTQIQHETAKIYQFRPRTPSTNGVRGFEVKAGVSTQKKQVSVAISCDSWYHEAAVQSADLPHKS